MISFAFKNLRAQPYRSFFIIAQIAIAVFGVICIFSFSHGVRTTVRSAVDQFRGVIVLEEGAMDPAWSAVPRESRERMMNVDGVKNVVPWIWAPATTVDSVSLSERGFSQVEAIGGIDIEANQKTPRAHHYPRNLVKGRFLKPGDTDQTVISTELANRYNRAIGDTITVRGEQLRIVGLYETGNTLLDVAYITPIQVARRIKSMDPEMVSNQFVVFHEDRNPKIMARTLEKKLLSHEISFEKRTVHIHPGKGIKPGEASLDPSRSNLIHQQENIEWSVPYRRLSFDLEPVSASSESDTSLRVGGIRDEDLDHFRVDRNDETSLGMANGHRAIPIYLAPAVYQQYGEPGTRIRANNRVFQVRGIARNLTETSRLSGLVPIDRLGRNAFTHVVARMTGERSPEKTGDLRETIEGILRELGVRTQQDWMTDFEHIMSDVDILLWLITALGIILGTVGILAIMLFGVFQRTGEFGILIANGWSRRSIVTLIMMEATILGIVGGLVGVVLGTGAVKAIHYAVNLTIQPALSPVLLLLSFLLALLLGICASIFPAYRTATMHPIDAIRSIA